jgi:RHS repeat-associated protein
MGCPSLIHIENQSALRVAYRKNHVFSKSSTGDHRYGFNGKEKDDEVNGNGNSYNFEGRSLYDGRLGKFVSVDPRFKDYAWQSPYAYFKNSPIHQIDFKGLGDDDGAGESASDLCGMNATSSTAESSLPNPMPFFL